MTAQRELDLVLMGATGYEGRLVARHLAEAAPEGVRIGLAGRSLSRLQDVRSGLGSAAASWPLVRADARDPGALAELAGRTRAVATTVGPYLRLGMPLLAACARAGTHYADLTGEVLFVREAADRHDAVARETGARLVHACGFDSVPSDLSVLELHRAATEDGAGELTDTTLLVERLRGGISGGTVDSLRQQLRAMERDPSVRQVVRDPYGLSPDRGSDPEGRGERDSTEVFQEHLTGRWVAPFVMAPFNTRIVRRSNALAGHAYGRDFRYRELASTGRGTRGYAVAQGIRLGTGAVVAGMRHPRLRGLVDRVLPAPGEGPSEQQRAAGSFRTRTLTVTTTGRRYEAVFGADLDPGYGGTAVMLGQAALALALDGDRLPERAGSLTPATAIGDVLVERLRDQGFLITAGPRG